MLDNLDKVRELDKSGMFELIYKFPDLCIDAINIAKSSVRGLRFHNFFNVVIAGLGGSAIGGDLMRMITANRAQIPVIVNRDYDLPGFVDERTLVIVSSYSGNTEETLRAYEHAKSKKAKIMVITTGGELKKRSMTDETPIITLPGGLPPRAALGYSFSAIFTLFQEQGIGLRQQFDIKKAIDFLKKIREKFHPKVPKRDNPAKSLAIKLYGKIPIIYGVSNLTDIVAIRWKGQLNENAKTPAFFNIFPELNHNEIMGFEGSGELLKNFQVIVLRSPYENNRVKEGIDITLSIINSKVGGTTELWPEGESALEHMLYHVVFGDYMSAYLAILNNKDPKEIGSIDEFKKANEELNILREVEVLNYEVDIHCHTIGSGHAYSTVVENAQVAAEKGLKMIAITDHGPAMGEGINKYFFANMVVIPRKIKGVHILKGIETNILDEKGTLDLPERYLSKLDIVLAGLHTGCYFGETVEENTKAIIGAIKNPYVDVIVHPGNPRFPLDIDKFVKAALEYNVHIEINNSSLTVSRKGSKQNCILIAKKAAELGAKVCLGSDAHICFDVGNFAEAEEIIKSSGISRENILNTSVEKVVSFLRSKGRDIILE